MANLGELIYSLGIDTSELKKSEKEIIASTQRVDNRMSALASKAKILAAAIATVYGALKVKNLVMEATQLASRYETLGVVLIQVGKNSHYGAQQLAEFQKGLESTGISMIESRQQLTRMLQAQIDLTKSTKLARVAQDAAVIGNINSSQAFSRMIWGIKTGQTRIMRTIGLNVSWERSYRKLEATLGRARNGLSEFEKMQARVNAALAEGNKISGTYTAAMKTAGKLVNSLVRYVQNAKIMFGDLFLPSYTLIINNITIAMKSLNKQLKDLISSGDVSRWGNTLVGALTDIKDTTVLLWGVLTAFPVGVIEYFVKLRKEVEKTRKDMEGILDIKLKRSTFDRWAGFFKVIGDNLIKLSQFLMKSFGVIGGYILEIFTVIIRHIARQWQDLGEGILSLITLNFSDAKDSFKRLLVDNTVEAFEEVKRAGTVFNSQFAENWNDMVDSLKDPFIEFSADYDNIITTSVRNITPEETYGSFMRMKDQVTKGWEESFSAVEEKLKNMRDGLEDQIAGFQEGANVLISYNKQMKSLEKMLEKVGPLGDEFRETITALNEELAHATFDKMLEGIQKYMDLSSDMYKYMSGYKAITDEYKGQKELLDKIIEDEMKLSSTTEERINQLAKMRVELRLSRNIKIGDHFKEQIDGLQNALNSISFAEAFTDPMLDGISKTMTLFNRLIESTKAYGEQLNVLEKKKKAIDSMDEGPDKIKALEAHYLEMEWFEEKSFKSKLNNMRNLMGAAAQMFDEESKARENLMKAEKVFAAIEIALALEVAAANAMKAITSAFSAPWPIQFAYGAAMIATMSALGVFGGSGGSAPPNPRENTGLGSVLGAPDEFSISAESSYEMLEKFHDLEYATLIDIYEEMRDLNYNITGVINSVVKGAEAGMFNIGIRAHSDYGSVGDFTQDVFNILGDTMSGWLGSAAGWVFGGSSEVSQTGGGLSFTAIDLEHAIANGMQVFKYGVEKEEVTGPLGGLWGNETNIYKKYSEIDDQLQFLFDQIFSDMGNTLLILAEGLGGDLDAALAYVFDLGEIDLLNKSAEEINDIISGVISKAGDDAAEAILGSVVSMYQQVNEGLLETAVRVLVGKEVVNSLLEKVGMSPVTRTRTSEDSAMRSMGFGGMLEKYDERLVFFNDYLGTTFDSLFDALVEYYDRWDSPGAQRYADNLLSAAESSAIALSQTLIALAGGLEEFTDMISSYYDKFYTDVEKMADIKKLLESALSDFDTSLPSTREDFRNLVESLDLSSESGQRLYIVMMELAGAADEYYNSLEKGVRTFKSFMDEFHSIADPGLIYSDSASFVDIFQQVQGIEDWRAKSFDEIMASYYAGEFSPDALISLWNALDDSYDELRSNLPLNMLDDFSDIIAKHTLSDDNYNLQKGLSDLQDWYDEQESILGGLKWSYVISQEDWAAQLNDLNLAMELMTDDLMSSFDKVHTDWRKFLDSMILSDLSPVQSIQAFENKYNKLLLGGMSDDYLNYITSEYLPFMQGVSGGGSDYKDIFNKVMADVMEAGLVMDSGTGAFDEELFAELLAEAINQNLEGLGFVINVDGSEIARVVADEISGGNVEVITAVLQYLNP